MEVRVKVIRAQEFLVLTVDGMVDLASSKAMLAALVTHAANLKGYQILIDFRRGTAEMSIQDIWDVAAELGRSGEWSQWKIAILVAPDADVEKTEFFEVCAKSWLVMAKVFREFEDAIVWLVASDTQELVQGQGRRDMEL